MQTIHVQLDDATIDYLTKIGAPSEVLARLAESAAQSIGDCLTCDRTQSASLVVDQREANTHMVHATIRAQELAVEAVQAKEQSQANERKLLVVAEFRELFMGILGHDLRTPVGSIIMGCGLIIQRGHLGQKDAETIALILRNGHRITRMITQLLDLTKARLGGGLPVVPTPVDLGELCRNAVQEFEAPIQLEVHGDMLGSWDQDRLAEVLSNLIGNATQYAARGTDVMIETSASEGEVVIRIKNQGDPIPDAVLPFIFEPFRRARQNEKSAAGNLGLGLYIANQIVTSHGGTIGAHCADHTTTFEVRLPRHTVSVNVPPSIRA